MKRPLMVLAAFLLMCAWLLAASCSNPLEVTRPTAPEIFDATDSVLLIDTLTICDTLIVSDSVIQVDTIVVTDSVYFTDTIRVADTVFLVDTLVRVDTVEVTVPVPGECPGLCAQLGSHQKEIVWLLNNAAGRYRLDFSASVERRQPQQTLIVSAGGKEHRWSPAAGSEFAIEVELGEHARIKLWFDHPKACGHAIDVCLNVTPL